MIDDRGFTNLVVRMMLNKADRIFMIAVSWGEERNENKRRGREESSYSSAEEGDSFLHETSRSCHFQNIQLGKIREC